MQRLALFVAAAIAAAPSLRADQWVSGQNAASVLGQPDFVSNTNPSLANQFSDPQSVAVDPTTGKVFVGDTGHRRILRFSSEAARLNGSFPEAVFGQSNFTSVGDNQGGPAAGNTLSAVYQIAVDQKGRLWVADSGNNRVLGFVAASSRGDNPQADFVFGQPDFSEVSAGTSVAKMSSPEGVAVGADDTLWVADTGNHRVLRFADISERSSGANADGVLGQIDFNSGTSATSGTRMNTPSSISIDSAGRLWVADALNHRVLRFDSAATLPNGSPASGVLGQPDFTTNAFGLNATSFRRPLGVLAGPDGTVYVGDYQNERVMGFRNASGKSNGDAADFVLGKPDFTSTASGPTQSLLSGPYNLALSPDGSLFVVDYDNYRVLRFVPVKPPSLTILTRKATTTKSSFLIKGSCSGPTSRVTVRVGGRGPFKTASGTATWSFRAKLKPGKNLITAMASGPGGTSAPKTVTITRK